MTEPQTTEKSWDEWVKEIEEVKGYKICAAKTADFRPCPNKAGKSTDHPGDGRCKYHGGNNQSPLSKSWKHGQLSKLKSPHPTLQQKMDQLANATDVFDLRNEILKLKAIIELLEEQSDWDRVEKFIVDMSKVVERLHNIEVGRRLVISIENVYPIVTQIVGAVNRHVPDENIRHQIAEEIKNVRLSMALPTAKETEIIDAEWKELENHARTTKAD